MKASEIASNAAKLLSADREKTHGPKRLNHQKIAALWNAYLGIRPDPSAPLSELDVALMMNQLKVARTQLGAHNPDDYVDMVGYAAIAGELAS